MLVLEPVVLVGLVFAPEAAFARVERQAAGLESVPVLLLALEPVVLAGPVLVERVALEAELARVEPQAVGFESELGKQVAVSVLGFVAEVLAVAELESLVVP